MISTKNSHEEKQLVEEQVVLLHPHIQLAVQSQRLLQKQATTQVQAYPSLHTHTFTPTIVATSTLPLYRQLKMIQYDTEGEPAEIPNGAIAIFDASVPGGWTQYSAQNTYYPYGEGTTGTTGGSNTHVHDITGTTGTAAGGEVAIKTANSAPAAAGSHTHTVTSVTGSVNNEPPYMDVIFGQINSTSSPVDDMIAMWDSTPGSDWQVVSTSTGAFYQIFIKGSATYGGTGGNATHTHVDVTGITSGSESATANTKSGAGSASGLHTHNVDVTGFSTDSHVPPYRDVIFAKRTFTNSLPVASSVSVDTGATSANLTEDTTKIVSCEGTVTDNNTYSDIISVTADFFRTSVGIGSGLDNNNHYRLIGNANCAPSNGSGNSETYTCDFDIQYYADPTDTGSTHAGEEWTCTMTPSDNVGAGTASSDTIEINTLTALNVVSAVTLNYGDVDPDTDTDTSNQTVSIRNTGNHDMDPELSGTNMTNGGDTLLVGQQKYSATSFTYSGGGTSLTGSATGLNITLPQGTSGTVPIEDDVLWGISIPNGTSQGTYTGTITITAANGL